VTPGACLSCNESQLDMTSATSVKTNSVNPSPSDRLEREFQRAINHGPICEFLPELPYGVPTGTWLNAAVLKIR
jgi:hypothetical protein